MRTFVVCLSLLVVVAATARADIPPENACDKPGEACDKAPPDYKSRGVCQTQKCSRQLPGPNGVERHEYDCNLCVPPDPAAKNAAGTTPPAANKKGGCSVGDGPGAIACVVLGLIYLQATRRRRRVA